MECTYTWNGFYVRRTKNCTAGLLNKLPLYTQVGLIGCKKHHNTSLSLQKPGLFGSQKLHFKIQGKASQTKNLHIFFFFICKFFLTICKYKRNPNRFRTQSMCHIVGHIHSFIHHSYPLSPALRVAMVCWSLSQLS